MPVTRKSLALGLALASVVLFAACAGESESEFENAAGEQETESAELTSAKAVTPVSSDHCLANITNYQSDGPFRYTSKRSGLVNMYIPSVPSGCKVPVVHFANGTGATCITYAAVLRRLASHGFFGVCYESMNTGAGDQGITAIQTALTQYPNLVDYRIGSTGHSQGGQAAFIVLQKAETKWASQGVAFAGLAIEPASGFGAQPSGGTWQSYYKKIKSPMFMFSGVGTDGLVSESWVRLAYSAMSSSVESYFWAASGATHIPVPNSLTNEVAIPWFRWKLLGDSKACQAFKDLERGSVWTQRAAKNEVSCN